MSSNKMLVGPLLLYLITTAWCITTSSAAFVVQSSSSSPQKQQQRHQRARPYRPASASTSSRSRLMVVASDALQEDKSKQRRDRDDDHDDDDNDWVPTATGGWFSPYLTRRLGREQPPEEEKEQQQAKLQLQQPAPAPSTPKPSKKKNKLMTEVKTMQEYKDQVVDEQDAIVCVRFYAPWCRACKAVEAPFKQLATRHSFAAESDNNNNKVQEVKFVQVPLTKENAYLHTGLGIPSLPYAHIYHPVAGLVEERSINKKIFGEFKDALQTYVDGECAIDWDSESSSNGEDNNKAAQVEEPLQ
jgi:thiol-disulfide isomerase/thioredoxin